MENLFKKIKSNISSPKKKAIINPHKHWIMIVKIFFAFFFLLLIFSLYLLYEIKNEKVFYVNTTIKPTQALLKDKLLEDISNSFEEKSKKSIDIKNNSIIFGDPSI